MKWERPIPVLLLVRELSAGGTERQLTETARRLDRRDFSPHVGCFHSDGMRAQELQSAGVPIVRFPVRSFGSLSLLQGLRQMKQYLASHRIGLVHTFDVPMTIFGVPAARLFGVPVVLASQRAYRELTPPMYRTVLRMTDRMAHGIVVNCAAIREHLERDYGVPPSRIHLCYNGIDTTVFQPAPQRSGSADTAGEVTIGGVYALRPEKGLEVLMDAFAIVHTACPRTRLLIVGSGSMEAELRKRASGYGLDAVCRFEPASPNVAEHLRDIDIFVLPSRSEALSNSLMEAMACGCACIATNVGGNPELVTSGETGMLFARDQKEDLAQLLQLLVRDRDLRCKLGAAAADRIRRDFDAKDLGTRMGDIYRSVGCKSKRWAPG